MNNTYAPIILFVYNRPDHTKRTVEGLLTNPEAKYSDLFIFSDGPKPNATEEALRKIEETRNYIHTISGFRRVIIDESIHNRGLANSTIRGCSKVINEYGKIIMLEDDDVPSKFFLSYINQCLTLYENDRYIWCVSGYIDSDIIPPIKDSDDYFLVNRPSSWGFGTWKRCWDKVIWDIETLKGLFEHQDIINGFTKWGGSDSAIIMFSLFEGKSNSWSIRYNFAAYLNHAFTILPNKSLIENIGCDGTGTHCGTINFHLKMMECNIRVVNELKFDAYRNKLLINSFKPTSFKEKVHYFVENHLFLRKIIHRS